MAMRPTYNTNYPGWDDAEDKSATDHNRYHDREPMDGYMFLPLTGILPWDGELSTAVLAGSVTCWVCHERPQVTEALPGLAVCCLCSRSSMDGDDAKGLVSLYGEPAGSRMNREWVRLYGTPEEKRALRDQDDRAKMDHRREKAGLLPMTDDEWEADRARKAVKVIKFKAKNKDKGRKAG